MRGPTLRVGPRVPRHSGHYNLNPPPSSLPSRTLHPLPRPLLPMPLAIQINYLLYWWPFGVVFHLSRNLKLCWFRKRKSWKVKAIKHFKNLICFAGNLTIWPFENPQKNFTFLLKNGRNNIQCVYLSTVYVRQKNSPSFSGSLVYILPCTQYQTLIQQWKSLCVLHGIIPAWKSTPTANSVPVMGIRASLLSFGSRAIPRIPSWMEYIRNESTPKEQQIAFIP